MNELEIILDLLIDARGQEKEPVATFKTNNILFEEVARIVGSADCASATETDAQRMERWLIDIASTVNGGAPTEEQSLKDVQIMNEIMEQISDKFAEKISTATGTLRSIKNDVSALTKAIAERKNQIIAVDPFLSSHVNIPEPTIEFDAFPFAELDVAGGQSALFAYVTDTTGQTTPTALQSRSSFELAFEKFATIKLGDNAVLNSIELSQEQKESIIDAVNAANKDILADPIRNTLTAIINPSTLQRVKSRMLLNAKQLETTEACLEMIALISTYRIIGKKLAAEMIKQDVVSEKITAFEQNLQFTDDMTDLAAFFVQWHRINTFKDTVMFRNKTVNPDKLEEMKKANVSMLELARHQRYHFGDQAMPTTGISLTALLNNKDRVRSEVEKTNSQIEIRVKAGTIRAEQDAFFKVMFEYFTSAGNATRVTMTDELSKMVRHKSTIMAEKGAACEDVLYDVIIRMLYHNDFVSILHKHLGVEYMKAVAMNKSLNANDIAMTNAGVYAAMVTDFMCTMFMEKTA